MNEFDAIGGDPSDETNDASTEGERAFADLAAKRDYDLKTRRQNMGVMGRLLGGPEHAPFSRDVIVIALVVVVSTVGFIIYPKDYPMSSIVLRRPRIYRWNQDE